MYDLLKSCSVGALMVGVNLLPILEQGAIADDIIVEDVAITDPDADRELVEGETGSVTQYDREYLDRLTNTVTAYDLANKVPGGQAIVNRGNNNGGNGQKSRGFSSNDDGILINGKRLSGKNSSSQDALARIPANQVVRIEIIRGSSPDVKVSSQEAFMNVILSADAANGSGTWDIGTRIAPKTGRIAPMATLSYSGSIGKLEYFVEASQKGFVADPKSRDIITDSDGLLEKSINETGKQYFRRRGVSTNLTYTLPNKDQIRLNGSYETAKMRRSWEGEVDEYLPDGSVFLSGESLQRITYDNPTWEIGGDYETSLGNDWRFKIIGLVSKDNSEFGQREDEFIVGDELEYDSDYIFYSNARETIFRPSVTWEIGDGRQLEFGDEVAFNKVAAGLDPVDLVTVKETRSETFMNYSWKINPKLHMDAALKFEYSRISQESLDLERSETFKFLKPSIDFRYDLNKRNQLQFSVRRNVSQLDFNDFATSISDDNVVIAGNEDLVPEKSWVFEASYERQFADDQGQVKIKLSHERITDHIEMLEISPGVAGAGNIGSGTSNTAVITTSLKLGFIGLPNVTLDGELEMYDSNTIDAFTGEKRSFDGQASTVGNITLRHDVDDLGLSYGIESFMRGPVTGHSIDQEYKRKKSIGFVSLFAEYKVFGKMILKGEVNNIFNIKEGRYRTVYDPSRSSGMVDLMEDRTQQWGTRLRFSLKGTF